MTDLLAIAAACTLFTALVASVLLVVRWSRRRADWATLQGYSRSGLVAWQLWRRRSKTLRITDRRDDAISGDRDTRRASGPSGP